MSYVFAGFFATPAIEAPSKLPEGAVWRDISTPFAGAGLRLPMLIGKSVQEEQVRELADALGIGKAASWVFLQYDCWGGQIDFVYGLGSKNGERFGPIEESNLGVVESAYTNLMSQFGVSREHALGFPPFERGFWGET